MVFLNKNREKGLKAKKKAQPIEKKPSTDIKPQPTQQVQPQQTQVKSQNNNNNNAAQNLLSSSPWWVSDVIFVVEGRKIPAHKGEFLFPISYPFFIYLLLFILLIINKNYNSCFKF